MPRRLEGCVALVTGAASGIGAACALRFAREGARVLGVDLKPAPDDVWRPVVEAAPGVEYECADVRNGAAVEAAVDAAIRAFGRLDIAINAAGVAGGGPVHLLDEAEWDRVVDINLKGTYLVCKAALRPMLEQQSGCLINIAGIEGIEGGSAYNASKAGVVLLTRNLAIDYGREGIRANCICPGFIQTPMAAALHRQGMERYRDAIAKLHMLGRWGRPEEIAGAALFLASEDASFVTGHALVVDGGFTAGTRLGSATSTASPEALDAAAPTRAVRDGIILSEIARSTCSPNLRGPSSPGA